MLTYGFNSEHYIYTYVLSGTSGTVYINGL